MHSRSFKSQTNKKQQQQQTKRLKWNDRNYAMFSCTHLIHLEQAAAADRQKSHSNEPPDEGNAEICKCVRTWASPAQWKWTEKKNEKTVLKSQKNYKKNRRTKKEAETTKTRRMIAAIIVFGCRFHIGNLNCVNVCMRKSLLLQYASLIAHRKLYRIVRHLWMTIYIHLFKCMQKREKKVHFIFLAEERYGAMTNY